MPQNSIPANPQVSQQIAAAGGTPVNVHPGAPAGIPMHPGVIAQRMQAAPPAAPAPASNPGMDFFSSGGGDIDDVGAPPDEGTATGVPPATDLVSVDDLLSGGQFPEPPPQTAQPPQELQQQVQPQPLAPQPQPAPQQTAPSPEQLRTQAIDYLRGSVYNMSDEDTRLAISEPEKVLPGLAARVHLNIANEMAQHIRQALPVMIEQAVTQRVAVTEAKNDFFRRYPKLQDPRFETVVAESLRMASQTFAGQPRDVIMREGATLAAWRLRSMFQQQPRQSAPNAPRPFVPAAPGVGAVNVPTNPQQDSNIWAQLAADPELMNY